MTCFFKEVIMRSKVVFTVLMFLLVIAGCNNLIEYSPYQAGVGIGKDHLNLKTIDSLSKKSSDSFQPFRIALFGDTHTFYDDFEDYIKIFNSMDSIDFVVHNGDLTNSGIYREFVWFKDIIGNLKLPLITIIGNHDFLGNGESVYEDMFGPLNFTMKYNNCKFVFFDDTVWEKNIQDPDFEWLMEACKSEENTSHVIVISHIPPWDDQLSIGNRYLFYKILDDNNVSLSIHGHTHSYFYGTKDGCKVPFLVTGDATDREIVLLDVQKDSIGISRKTF
jgi:Icc-related predicted phosphoesterase